MLNLRKIREKKRLSQAELADMVGVTQRAISIWEDEGGNPTVKNLAKLAQVLQVGLEELVDIQDGTTDSSVAPMDKLINLLHQTAEAATQLPKGVRVLSAELGGINLTEGLERVAEEYGVEITTRPFTSNTNDEWEIKEITIDGIRIQQYDRKETKE